MNNGFIYHNYQYTQRIISITLMRLGRGGAGTSTSQVGVRGDIIRRVGSY